MTKKTKIFVCSHGDFSKELIRSAEMIIGKMEDATSFCLKEGMSPIDFRDKIVNVIKEEDEIIFLVDLFGGTPSNVCLTFSKSSKVKVISGVNLGMLIEVYSQKDSLSLSELALLAESIGKEACRHIILL